MPDRRAPRTIAALLLALVLAVASACGGSSEPPAEARAASDSGDAAPVESTEPTGPLAELATVMADSPVEIFPEPEATTPSTTLSGSTSYGLPRTFLVREKRGDWLKVLLPMRPNGSEGWIRSDGVRLDTTDFRIEVHLAEYELRAYQGDELILEAPVGLAKENFPTPPGEYYITDLVQPPDPDTVYGTFAYGLSGYSEVLTTFNGGDGQLGIHGTNKPDSIGKNDSHGCVRLRNEDIEKLVPLLPLGTPVSIIA